MRVMDITTPAMNGKSHHHSLITTALAPSVDRSTKRGRLLELVGKAVDLEFQLKETMRALEAEAQAMGPDELPSMLMSILGPTVRPTSTPTKGPSIAKVVPPSFAPDSLKGRIMNLMRDGRKRKSSAIIKSIKATNVKSSAYHALKQLLEEGHLTKPEYGFYCKA